ncbi:MAG: Threonine--tRNA ligase, partial [Myxococcaceae bacterium]|nr:Threonine--tRNA ligase [Myxococcaceae bacterium]
MNQANQQTPKEILEAKGKLDKDIVAVRIDGKIVDLHTPVDAAKAETMKPVRTNEKDGLDVIRH